MTRCRSILVYAVVAVALTACIAFASSAGLVMSAPPAQAQAQGTITVTTTTPGVNESDGQCSLAEAIYSANFDDNIAITSTPPDTFVSTDCAPGNGADTIVLPASAEFDLSSVTDDLYNLTGPTATPLVFTPITIEGNGAVIERTGSALMRAFAVGSASIDTNPGGTPAIVSGTGDLTLRNLRVRDFYARGGDGGQLGGGGGLGAGGAVYVRAGTLVVENSTFDGNRAEGGNGGNAVNATDATGSSFATDGGGGGGGLSGSGGRAAAFAGYADCPDCGSFGGGGGGGGGGARGAGGSAFVTVKDGQYNGGADGGGGGGTLTGGQDAPRGFGDLSGSAGGVACGGDGGHIGEDGHDGCDGGGAGGGPEPNTYDGSGGQGGRGGYGGGGGGGGYVLSATSGGHAQSGGHGGFGAGGGAGGRGANGGAAGFGAGGGGGHTTGGASGTFGGDGGRNADGLDHAVIAAGGGGGGLGGAIFSDGGAVTVRNSTFTGNSVSHGFAGDDRGGYSVGATNGSDAGAAIFAVDGSLTVSNATISGNESTGDAAGIAMYRSSRSGYSATLNLTNTIVAANVPEASECKLIGSVAATGTANVFTDNLNCPGDAVSADPALAPLATEPPGDTPTMAIDPSSPAFDAGDDATCEPTDQRGAPRPQSTHCDIGAYEVLVDTTPPSAAPTASPAANGYGWNNSDVTVSWNWTDAESGVDPANCTTSSTSSGEGAAMSLSAGCTDLAGNTGTASYGVSVDKTAPTVICGTVPSFTVGGASDTDVTATVTDALSGPAASTVSTDITASDVATPGVKSKDLTGEDKAGNTTTVSCTYTVAYRFLGFLEPIPRSSYKRGSAIPVKFRLGDAAGDPIPDADAEALLSPTCHVQVTLDGVAQGCVTYDSSSDIFQLDLRTPKSLEVGTHTVGIRVTAADGSGVLNTDSTTILIRK